MDDKLRVQMDEMELDPQDPLSILAILRSSQEACDSIGFHEGAMALSSRAFP